MADGAQNGLDKSQTEVPVVEMGRDMVLEAAAGLYGRGYKRGQIARALLDQLVTTGRDRPDDQRMAQARAKLRRWERTQSFRDLVWDRAVVELDMETPNILKGIAKKGKRGRTDAARLALEVTGRHNPKGDQQPTQVAVIFQGIPRPGMAPSQVVVDGQAVEEEEA